MYAWSWFALHAGQRLQLVNFWLVAVAFLASAYVQARSSHLFVIALGVSITGAVASLAFARLDGRTRQLVQVASATESVPDLWLANSRSFFNAAAGSISGCCRRSDQQAGEAGKHWPKVTAAADVGSITWST